MSKSPIHVQVEARQEESVEKMIKRFLRKCKKEGIQELFMRSWCGAARYTKPSVLKRQKKIRGLRLARNQNKQNNLEE